MRSCIHRRVLSVEDAFNDICLRVAHDIQTAACQIRFSDRSMHLPIKGVPAVVTPSRTESRLLWETLVWKSMLVDGQGSTLSIELLAGEDDGTCVHPLGVTLLHAPDVGLFRYHLRR